MFQKSLWGTMHCGISSQVCFVPVPIWVSLLTGSNLITCPRGVQGGWHRSREARNNEKCNSKTLFFISIFPRGAFLLRFHLKHDPNFFFSPNENNFLGGEKRITVPCGGNRKTQAKQFFLFCFFSFFLSVIFEIDSFTLWR